MSLTLAEFLVQHREELCRRAQGKAWRRAPPRASAATLEGGVPLFLDQLVDLLQGVEASRNSDIGSRHGCIFTIVLPRATSTPATS